MSFFSNFLKKRKQNKIRKKIAVLQEQSMQYQRNGNLRGLAHIVEQITDLEAQLDE